MYPSASCSVFLCGVLTQVWGSKFPHIHPNVSSGDLLEYSDYSDPITPSSVKLPAYMRHDKQQNVVVMFTMVYGDEDKIVQTTKDEMIMTKRVHPAADLSEIWHIQEDDMQLKFFFSKVLDLDPSDVTVVNIAFGKKESVKKILIQERVMNASDILAKLIAAEGKTF
ncbi:uncharacterized protein LOC124354778 [Homalodisca vitripennis]|nr:uncharacterized protein LOC124354778 [Homalodisca vitripennis]KAG8307839.1 hypothetical protein J6590_010272 [Homalodisca vitripennis]